MTDSTTKIPFSDPPYLMGMPSPYYKPTHLKWQKACRAFLAEHLLPYAMEWETEETVPEHVFGVFGKANMLIPNLPSPLPVEWLKRLGIHDILGTPLEEWDYIHTGIYLDELSRTGLSGPGGSLTTGIAFGVPPIIKFGNKQLQERFLPDLLTCKTRACIAITEPSAGSDVANIQTTAVKSKDGKHYIVNGQKKWITNGVWAEVSAMAVRTGGPGPGGLSMLVVPLKGYPGVTMRRLKVGGQISAGTTFIELDDVKVPVENLIGTEGMGMKYVMTNFNHERLTIAVGVTRQARVALSAAFEYCMKREAFGKTLMEQPVVRHRLAKAGAELETLQAWVEQFVYQMTQLTKEEADTKLGGLTALAKAKAGMVLNECAQTAVLLFGGNGYTRTGQGAIAEKIYRDVNGARIPGGSEDVMLDLAIRQLVKNFKNQTQMQERPKGSSNEYQEFRNYQELSILFNVIARNIGDIWAFGSGTLPSEKAPGLTLNRFHSAITATQYKPQQRFGQGRLVAQPGHIIDIPASLDLETDSVAQLSALRPNVNNLDGLSTRSNTLQPNIAAPDFKIETDDGRPTDHGRLGASEVVGATPAMLRFYPWNTTEGLDKDKAPELRSQVSGIHQNIDRFAHDMTTTKRKRSTGQDANTVAKVSPVDVTPNVVRGVRQIAPLSMPPSATYLTSTLQNGPTPPMSPTRSPDKPLVTERAYNNTHALPPSKVESFKRHLKTQIGLEILLKHDELRFIEQEMGKCQIALEQLRRCTEIPYPATTMSLDVSNGTGLPAQKTSTGLLPRSPAPWGATDGPYSRHYAKWLLPDPAFDGGDERLVPRQHSEYARSTRGKPIETVIATSRRGNKSKSPLTLSAPKDKSGPMIIKRKADGKMVKLRCLDCARDDFGSAQGFINHCRIQHHRNFTSHDAAAAACGEVVDVDPTGAILTQTSAQPALTTSGGVVHPLIRSAHLIKSGSEEVEETDDESRIGGVAHVNRATPEHFQPSPLTPNLSALIRNRGLGINVQDLVSDAKTTLPPIADLDDNDSEEDTDTLLFRGPHPQVAGSKQPASLHSRQGGKTSSFGQLRGGALGSPMHAQLISHDASELELEPSPTTESNQAPSLVDDDEDDDYEGHSPTCSSEDGSEVNFHIEDEDMAGPSTNLSPLYQDAAKQQSGLLDHRPSAFRRHFSNSREEKHVSFVSPGPGQDLPAHEPKRRKL